MSDSEQPNYAPEVDGAAVDAIGEPGQRRFRLISNLSGETIIIWMEKQQLEALGHAIHQILLQTTQDEASLVTDSDSPAFDLETDEQFRVGRFEVGYDARADRVLMVAYDLEAEAEDDPSFMALFSRQLARELAEESETIVAAGRPVCVLCGRPMGPGSHACAMQNGHLMH